MSGEARPIYARIADELRAAILARSLGPGDALPSEHELASRYDASRVTVRKALNVLCSERLVHSRQGKGYFVRDPEYSLYALSFDLIRPEHVVRYRLMEIVETRGEAAEALSLAEGSPVVHLRLVVLDGPRPLACEDKYLPYRKGFPTIESVTHNAEFPELVDRKLYRIAMHCDLRLRPARLDAERARLLGRKEGEPALLARRLIQSDGGRRLGYSLAYLLEEYGELAGSSGYAISKPAAEAKPAADPKPAAGPG